MLTRARRPFSLGFDAGLEFLEPRAMFAADAPLALDFQKRIDFNQTQEVDVDGDGRLDLVAISHRQVGIALSDGLGGYSPARYVGFNAPVSDVAVGDLDGDGDGDIAVLTGNRLVRVFDDGPSAYFTRRALFDLGYHSLSLTLGQFSDDGILDVAVMQPPVPGRNTPTVRLIIQDADGDLAPGLGRPTNYIGGVLSTAQARPGGTDEIVMDTVQLDGEWMPSAERVVTFAVGSVRLKVIADEPGIDAPAAAIADVNNDGEDDFISFISGFVGLGQQTHIGISVRDDAFEGGFVQLLVGTFNGFVITAGLHDFTGDGREDILLIGRLSDVIVVGPPAYGLYLMEDDGTGNYEQPREIAVIAPVFGGARFTDVDILGYSDTNLDGTPDILLETRSDSGFDTLEGGSFGSSVLTIESPGSMDPQGDWTTRMIFGHEQGFLETPVHYFAKLVPNLLGANVDGLVLVRDSFIGTGGVLVCPVA